MSLLGRLLRLASRPGEDTDVEHGEPGEGKVPVTVRRDWLGHPVEVVWADEAIAWQYDDTRWRGDWRRG